MHALTKTIGAAIVAGLLMLDASAQSVPFPDQRYRIKVALNGVPIDGGQELVVAMNANPSDPNKALDAPSPVLTRNRSYQLQVTITDPSGVTRDYTGSPLIRYAAVLDCLTTTSRGVVTATPSSSLCPETKSASLWVVLTDTGGNPVAYNGYEFNIIDGTSGPFRARPPEDLPPPYPPPPLPTF